MAGYKLNAHFATQNIEKMDLAARMGYQACVTIPKRTTDGVWVCFHDETVGTQLKDANGHTPADNHPEITGNVSVEDLTYTELQTYTFDADYLGIKRTVVKLEDFFRICSRTGMNPMLSVHPGRTVSEYEEIKAMAIRNGVLDRLELKPLCGEQTCATLKTVFGNNIKSVYFQIGNKTATEGLAYIANYDVDRTMVDVGVTINLVSKPSFTASDAQPYIETGYTVVLYHPSLTGEQFKYWMDNGVHQFTDNSNFSNGLNW